MRQRLQTLLRVRSRSDWLVPLCLVVFAPVWDQAGLTVAAFLLLAFVFLQASLYWHLKGKALAQERALLAWFRPAFLFFRWFDRVAILVVVVTLLRLHNELHELSVALAAFYATFALVEYINYFEWQLAHFNPRDIAHLRATRRLRRSALWRDMRAHSTA